jgi:hypothetical protein
MKLDPRGVAGVYFHVPSAGLMMATVILAKEDSDWLDTLAAEIYEASGAELSRSEIVHAAIAGVRELHLRKSGGLSVLMLVKEASHLEVMTVDAAKKASERYRELSTNG